MPSANVAIQAEPVWDLALLFPYQGMWTEEEYLNLNTNHLVEFSQGEIKVLSMPTESHQIIVLYLYRLLSAFVERTKLGMILVAPLRVRLWPGKIREPDVVLMLAEHAHRRHEQYWEAPDLVIEVVSPDYRHHDTVTKRRDYAQAGIPEYWIVDPGEEQITVLVLEEGSYREHRARRGEVATSVLLPGFQVEVGELVEIGKSGR